MHEGRPILKGLQALVHNRADADWEKVLEDVEAYVAQHKRKKTTSTRRERSGRDRQERGGFDRSASGGDEVA